MLERLAQHLQTNQHLLLVCDECHHWLSSAQWSVSWDFVSQSTGTTAKGDQHLVCDLRAHVPHKDPKVVLRPLYKGRIPPATTIMFCKLPCGGMPGTAQDRGCTAEQTVGSGLLQCSPLLAGGAARHGRLVLLRAIGSLAGKRGTHACKLRLVAHCREQQCRI